MSRSAMLALTIACAATLLAGCAQDPVTAAMPSTNVEVIDQWLSYAREEGKASDEQIQTLEAARAAGGVTRADLDEATAKYLECMDDAGVDYIVQEEEILPGSGVYVPGVMIPAPDPNSNREIDISDACEYRHQVYILSVYGNQPVSVEAQNRVWMSDGMRSCLQERGYPSDPDATVAEVQELFNADASAHADEPGFRSCLVDQ